MTTTTPDAAQAIDHAHRELVDRYDAVASHERWSAQMPPINLVLDPNDVATAAQDKAFVHKLNDLANTGRAVGIHVRLTRVFHFGCGTIPGQLRHELNYLTDLATTDQKG